MKYERFYMAVSNDRYELPIFLTDTVKEMAEWAGRSNNDILRAISTGRKCKRNNCRFERVIVNDFLIKED